MDLRLYARVLWRFRLLVLVGLALALSLSFLSIVRIEGDGLKYREQELWTSMPTRLQMTRARATSLTTVTSERLNELAILYAQLADSDRVRELMRRNGPVRGKVVATALKEPGSGLPLPLVELTAISTSRQDAVLLAQRGADALNDYLQEDQRADRVPPRDRVVLDMVVRPRGAAVYQSRSKTMAIVIFLVVMLAIVGLAFALENLRPRPRELSVEQPDREDPPVRRTA